MGYFRSSLKQSGGSGEDYSATYTTTVNGVLDKGSCNSMFAGNALFNEEVEIGNNVISCAKMFNSCTNFNRNVQIPNNVYDCTNMFSMCYKFNQNIQTPNNKNAILNYMFWHCNNLNQKISISDAYSCRAMFYFCNNLNQNIQISDNVAVCNFMFACCENLNQNIKIPNNAVDCSGMFYKCAKFNQHNIVIPEKVAIISGMFEECNNLMVNLYIKGNVYRELNAYGLFGNNNSKRKNIWINNVFYNIMHDTPIIADSTYIVPTWTTITNGFYNSKYNVYCYTNYSG